MNCKGFKRKNTGRKEPDVFSKKEPTVFREKKQLSLENEQLHSKMERMQRLLEEHGIEA
ncbi:MAG: hypothetical protein LIO96_00965 [Lachnospiraceae bacterium]|nr:hypothetical protein [Lachnospiraceae bacterium]